MKSKPTILSQQHELERRTRERIARVLDAYEGSADKTQGKLVALGMSPGIAAALVTTRQMDLALLELMERGLPDEGILGLLTAKIPQVRALWTEAREASGRPVPRIVLPGQSH